MPLLFVLARKEREPISCRYPVVICRFPPDGNHTLIFLFVQNAARILISKGTRKGAFFHPTRDFPPSCPALKSVYPPPAHVNFQNLYISVKMYRFWCGFYRYIMKNGL